MRHILLFGLFILALVAGLFGSFASTPAKAQGGWQVFLPLVLKPGVNLPDLVLKPAPSGWNDRTGDVYWREIDFVTQLNEELGRNDVLSYTSNAGDGMVVVTRWGIGSTPRNLLVPARRISLWGWRYDVRNNFVTDNEGVELRRVNLQKIWDQGFSAYAAFWGVGLAPNDTVTVNIGGESLTFSTAGENVEEYSGGLQRLEFVKLPEEGKWRVLFMPLPGESQMRLKLPQSVAPAVAASTASSDETSSVGPFFAPTE